MNTFFKQENSIVNFKLVTLILFACVLSFAFLTKINERKIQIFYLDKIKLEEKSYETLLKDKELSSDKGIQNEYKAVKEKHESYISSNQSFFLKEEIENLRLNQELVEEFKNLSYTEYNSGKKQVNNYLLAHKLSLKSVQYSLDSTIFLMNILEFMCTPIFFFFFFLLTTYSYFLKYENRKVNLLFTLPISKRKIIQNDYFSFLVNLLKVSSLIILIGLISSFLASFQFDWDYPILITLFQKTTIIPVVYYIVMLIVAYFFIATFFFFLCYFIVSLTKKAILSLLISLLICLSMNYFTENSTSFIYGFSPFSYINVEKLVKSKISDTNLKYVLLSDKHLNDEVEISPNIVENPYYYANDSISNSSEVIDIVLLPIVLGLYSILLFFLILYKLSRY